MPFSRKEDGRENGRTTNLLLLRLVERRWKRKILAEPMLLERISLVGEVGFRAKGLSMQQPLLRQDGAVGEAMDLDLDTLHYL